MSLVCIQITTLAIITTLLGIFGKVFIPVIITHFLDLLSYVEDDVALKVCSAEEIVDLFVIIIFRFLNGFF